MEKENIHGIKNASRHYWIAQESGQLGNIHKGAIPTDAGRVAITSRPPSGIGHPAMQRVLQMPFRRNEVPAAR
jgi:hypothetical protein